MLNFPLLVPNCAGSSIEPPWRLRMNDGTYRDATEAEILTASKHEKKETIRAEAGTRIIAKYPEWRQRSAALGVYPVEYVSQMQSDIAAVITATNVAEDAVDSALTVAAVEAVTVTWPVI